MGKLIRFELRKLFRSKYLYVIMAVSIAFILITGATTLVIKNITPETVTDSYLFSKSALGGTYSILVGIFVAIAATEDNASGTMKNVIAKGYNRLKVFAAKYLVSFIGVLFISLITLVVAIIFGAALMDKNPIQDNIAIIVLGQLFGLLAWHALYYAISSGFGKIGPAIAVSLVGPMAVTLILTLVDTTLKIKGGSVSKYWIDSLFNNFTGTTDPSRYAACFGLLAAYFAISLFIGFMINRKREY